MGVVRPLPIPLLAVPLLLAGLLLAGCSRDTGIDPNDRVDYQAMIARSQARNEARQQVEIVQAKIAEFQLKYNRLPSALHELVHFRLLDALPEPPNGMAYYYDPRLGSVRLGPAQQADREHIGGGIGAPSLTE